MFYCCYLWDISVHSTWFHGLLCRTLPCILAENTFSLVAVIVGLLTCFSKCFCNFLLQLVNFPGVG